MKKVIFITIVGSALLLLGGCAAVGKIVEPSIQNKSGKKFRIAQHSEGYYSVAAHEFKDSKVLSGFKYQSPAAGKRKRVVLKNLFEAAARFTKKQGYAHFVLVNPEFNNLTGFPISDLEQFIRYATLEDRKKNFDTISPYQQNSLISKHGDVQLLFKPVGSKVVNSGVVSTWKVSDFL